VQQFGNIFKRRRKFRHSAVGPTFGTILFDQASDALRSPAARSFDDKIIGTALSHERRCRLAQENRTKMPMKR
jgi:hypothetical protein